MVVMFPLCGLHSHTPVRVWPLFSVQLWLQPGFMSNPHIQTELLILQPTFHKFYFPDRILTVFFFHFLTPGCNGVFHWLSVFFSIFSNYPVFFISAFLIHVFETASHLFNVLKVFLLLQLCIQMFWNDPTLHFRTFSVKGHSHHIFHITFWFFFLHLNIF